MNIQNESISISTNTVKQSLELKFGIDRLLAREPNIASDEIQSLRNITKPKPTIRVPCSDCVTSLFRCCGLNSNNNTIQEPSELFIHQGYGNSRNVYTVQPIRPFATRPGKLILLHLLFYAFI